MTNQTKPNHKASQGTAVSHASLLWGVCVCVIVCVYLDVDGVEGLAVVDADNGADHVREDDDIAEVGVHDGGLLVLGAVGLGLAQLLHQSDGALGQAARQSAALARAHHSGHLGLGLLEKVLEVNTCTHTYMHARAPKGLGSRERACSLLWPLFCRWLGEVTHRGS